MSPPFFPKLRKGLHTACIWYCLTIFALMLGVVLLQVLTRNILGLPMPWAEESSIYMMISLGLLGSAFVLMERGQLCVDLIINKFPVTPRNILHILMLCIQILFVGLIVYFSFGSLEYASRVQAISLGITMRVPYLSIPIAFGLMLLELFFQLAEALYTQFSARRGGAA